MISLVTLDDPAPSECIHCCVNASDFIVALVGSRDCDGYHLGTRYALCKRCSVILFAKWAADYGIERSFRVFNGGK